MKQILLHLFSSALAANIANNCWRLLCKVMSDENHSRISHALLNSSEQRTGARFATRPVFQRTVMPRAREIANSPGNDNDDGGGGGGQMIHAFSRECIITGNIIVRLVHDNE